MDKVTPNMKDSITQKPLWGDFYLESAAVSDIK